MTDQLPAERDQTIVQGATWRKQFNWSTEGTPNVQVDLTGWTARMQVRGTYADFDTGEPLLDLTTENGGIVLGGVEDWNIEVLATAVQTEGLQRSTVRRYDLELIAPVTGYVTRLLQGRIHISLEVTRG